MRKLGPGWGLTTNSTWYEDEETGDLIQHTHGDVEPTLIANVQAQNEWGGRFGDKEFFHKVAEIPYELIHKWIAEEGLSIYDKQGFEDVIKKKLNNGEFAKLKTKNVTI